MKKKEKNTLLYLSTNITSPHQAFPVPQLTPILTPSELKNKLELDGVQDDHCFNHHLNSGKIIFQ